MPSHHGGPGRTAGKPSDAKEKSGHHENHQNGRLSM